MFRAQVTHNNAHLDEIWSVSWTPDGRILSGSLDKTAGIWDDQLSIQHVLGDHEVGVLAIRSANKCPAIITSGMDNIIRLFDAETGLHTHSIEAGIVEGWSVAISCDDKLMATGSKSGAVNIWGMQSLEKVAALETRDGFIMSVEFSPNGKIVVSGGIDGMINLFDVEKGKLLQKIEGHSLPIRSVCFSPDGNLLYTASDDRHIKVYDVKRGGLVGSFGGHASKALCVHCSPDGKHFISSGADSAVKIWDLASKQCVQTLDSIHEGYVWGVAYSPDGLKVISGGADGTLQLYET